MVSRAVRTGSTTASYQAEVVEVSQSRDQSMGESKHRSYWQQKSCFDPSDLYGR